MNVYDQLHGLEKAIKESEEFKQFQAVKVKVAANEELDSMIKDYQAKQMELQMKQAMGESIEAEAMKLIQPLYEVMMKDPTAAEFLQCEMRFGMMMNDVYKVLTDLVAGK